MSRLSIRIPHFNRPAFHSGERYRWRGANYWFAESIPPGYISRHVRLPQNHKLLAFLPLVFVIGTEGFAMFAPYVLLLLAVAHFARRLKQAPPAAAPIAV